MKVSWNNEGGNKRRKAEKEEGMLHRGWCTDKEKEGMKGRRDEGEEGMKGRRG